MNKTKLRYIISLIPLLMVASFATMYVYRTQIKTVSESSITAEVSKNNESENSPQLDSNKSSKIQSIINDWSRELSVESAVYFEMLNADESGYRAVSSANEPVVPASIYKIFLIYAYLYEVEQGTLTLNQVVYQNLTADECIKSLILVSSDACAFSMGRLIGWDKIDNFLLSQGYSQTIINNYNQNGEFIGDKQSSAADIGLLFSRLASQSLLRIDLSEYMIELMSRQEWRERIPAGVPSSVKVADKPGWLTGITENDAAVVYSPQGTYILVILTSGASIDSLADLSRQIYAELVP